MDNGHIDVSYLPYNFLQELIDFRALEKTGNLAFQLGDLEPRARQAAILEMVDTTDEDGDHEELQG